MHVSIQYISKLFYLVELAHKFQNYLFKSETIPWVISWTLGLFSYLKLLLKASNQTHLCPKVCHETRKCPKTV